MSMNEFKEAKKAISKANNTSTIKSVIKQKKSETGISELYFDKETIESKARVELMRVAEAIINGFYADVESKIQAAPVYNDLYKKGVFKNSHVEHKHIRFDLFYGNGINVSGSEYGGDSSFNCETFFKLKDQGGLVKEIVEYVYEKINSFLDENHILLCHVDNRSIPQVVEYSERSRIRVSKESSGNGRVSSWWVFKNPKGFNDYYSTEFSLFNHFNNISFHISFIGLIFLD